MKIISVGEYIRLNPDSGQRFRDKDRGKEQPYKSILPNYNQRNSISTGKLQDKTINKTAQTASGFFNAKNSPSFGNNTKPEQMGKFANWVTDSPIAHKFLKLSGKNPAVFESVAALAVAGVLRPATIMSLPASKADKEKNKKAAAHSISSGLIGLATTVVFFQPITKALQKLDEHPEKYGLDKNGEMYKVLKISKDGVTNEVKRKTIFQSFFKYAPKLLIAPLMAASTIALIPVIDKHIINKVFKSSDLKNQNTTKNINSENKEKENK